MEVWPLTEGAFEVASGQGGGRAGVRNAAWPLAVAPHESCKGEAR